MNVKNENKSIVDIYIDPSKDQIESAVDKTDGSIKLKYSIKELIKLTNYIKFLENDWQFEISHIHYYSEDECFIIGIKNPSKMRNQFDKFLKYIKANNLGKIFTIEDV